MNIGENKMAINVELFDRLIDAVENGLPKIAFGMSNWDTSVEEAAAFATDDEKHILYNDETIEEFKTCDSVCCIGGTLEHLVSFDNTGYLHEELGVDEHEWDHMCYPKNAKNYLATRKEAADALRYMKETGLCGWDRN